MAITTLLSDPWFEGVSTTVETPGRYPVALGGRGYLLDSESGDHQWRSIPLLREQVDMGTRPGEASLNPEAGWRRSQESWHLGAGQDAYDRVDSDPFRFDESKGVDPWTPWRLGLLPDTEQVASEDTTTLAVASERLFSLADESLSVSDDGIEWGPVEWAVSSAGHVHAVVWSPELEMFLAGGYSHWVATSSDALVWTTYDCPIRVRVLAWSPELELFVAAGGAVGGDPELATSPDGETWTEQATPFTVSPIYSLAWSPDLDLFVAGGRGEIATSPDGETWTLRSSPIGHYVNGIVWSSDDSQFVAVGNSGSGGTADTATSSDGETWTQQVDADFKRMGDVVWSSSLGLYVAGNDSSHDRHVYTSSDGETWTEQTDALPDGDPAIVWSPELELFVAALYISGEVATSPDGVTWTTVHQTDGYRLRAIAWSPELELFVIGGTFGFLASSPDGVTWTRAVSPGAITAIASDGQDLYSTGAEGVHVIDPELEAAVKVNDLDGDELAFVNGRLMAGVGDSIYEIVSTESNPSAHYTHPSSSARWRGFASGPQAIYAAAQVGDAALIYRIGVDDTGDLEVPTVAATFVGEHVYAIQGHANSALLIGMDDGFRVATFNSDGSLSVGARIPTGAPVRCFAGWQEYVWFGWSDFDSDSSGLGRIDLTRFTSGVNVFAYASDLMATDTGKTTSVVSFGDRRYFGVAGSGVWREADTKVADGWFTTGEIAYGVPADKIVNRVMLAGDEGTNVDVDIAANGGEFTRLGTVALGNITADHPGGLRGERFDLRFTIDGVLRRWTLEAEPEATDQWHIFAPLLISETEIVPGGAMGSRPLRGDLEHVIGLWRDAAVVTWQEGSFEVPVRVVDWEWAPQALSSDNAAFNGTVTVKMKKVTG
ncbi:MAG: hypothetical protein ACLFRV_03975 [Acidimicrobiales bacterium]